MLIDVTRPENKSAQGEVDDGSRSVGPFWQGSHNIIAGISKPVMPGTPVARSTRSATPHRPHQSTLHHGNVFTLVTDRDRVTDHPRNASYFSKQSTFTTLPNLVTTGGLCVTHKKRVLCAGAPSGCKVLSISTEERSLSSISLPPPPMSTTSSSPISSPLVSRFRGLFLILMHFICVYFEELSAVEALAENITG